MSDRVPFECLPARRRLLFPLLHAEKGRLRNAVANRVPASRWQGILFRINCEVGRQTVKVRGWKSEVFDLGLFSNLNFSDFCAIFSYLSQTPFLLSQAPF